MVKTPAPIAALLRQTAVGRTAPWLNKERRRPPDFSGSCREVAYDARRNIALDLRGVVDLLHSVSDLRNGHAVGKLGLRLMAVSWAPAGLYWADGLSRCHHVRSFSFKCYSMLCHDVSKNIMKSFSDVRPCVCSSSSLVSNIWKDPITGSKPRPWPACNGPSCQEKVQP